LQGSLEIQHSHQFAFKLIMTLASNLKGHLQHKKKLGGGDFEDILAFHSQNENEDNREKNFELILNALPQMVTKIGNSLEQSQPQIFTTYGETITVLGGERLAAIESLQAILKLNT
jgi:hypothetical protein